MANHYDYSENRTQKELFRDHIGFDEFEWVRFGRSLSEYNEMFGRWSRDPELFDKAFMSLLPSDSISRVFDDAVVGKNKTSGAGGSWDYVGEYGRIKRQSEEEIHREDDFKIGTVRLSIPPGQITVSEVRSNQIIKTLRQKSDIVLQTGHGIKLLEFDVVFNGLEEINTKLRPLIAQLKCSPFTPIYNEHVNAILFPDMGNINVKRNGGNRQSELCSYSKNRRN